MSPWKCPDCGVWNAPSVAEHRCWEGGVHAVLSPERPSLVGNYANAAPMQNYQNLQAAAACQSAQNAAYQANAAGQSNATTIAYQNAGYCAVFDGFGCRVQ